MKDPFRFRSFPVYNDSKNFVRACFDAVKELREPSLKSQIQRAATSIVLNIAEGSAKGSDKDFARYLSSAIGSVNELIAAFDLCNDLGLLSPDVFSKIETQALTIIDQLSKFRTSLKR